MTTKSKQPNWNLIISLPADGVVYPGSPEYRAYRVRHVPATKWTCAQALAETDNGIQRRRLVAQPNAPAKWLRAELLGGDIALDF